MNLPNRKSLRLKTYDYSLPGAYFVTVCTHKRQRLFCPEWNGTQAVPYADGENSPSVGHDLCVVPPSNAIIHKWIKETEHKFKISIDKHIIMPDHIHLLILIEKRHGSPSLPEIMRWFKTMTTNEYIRAVKAGALPTFHQKLWQKSYHDHVVRNDEDYEQTWLYIENNPQQRLIDIENAQKKKINPHL